MAPASRSNPTAPTAWKAARANLPTSTAGTEAGRRPRARRRRVSRPHRPRRSLGPPRERRRAGRGRAAVRPRVRRMTPRGSTLLEALVALAIAAVVLAALSGATVRARAARTAAVARSDRLGAGRSLLVRLAAELEAARRPGPGERFVLHPPADGASP